MQKQKVILLDVAVAHPRDQPIFAGGPQIRSRTYRSKGAASTQSIQKWWDIETCKNKECHTASIAGCVLEGHMKVATVFLVLLAPAVFAQESHDALLQHWDYR